MNDASGVYVQCVRYLVGEHTCYSGSRLTAGETTTREREKKTGRGFSSGTMTLNNIVVLCALLLCGAIGTEAIRCFQCSSDTDPKGKDLCGAYTQFDKETNVPIECNSEESNMPGTFCVKLTEQSPRGFIWDGRWRQVIRRCASVASTGVTGVCNWGVRENGVFWQECYCSEDACNAASSLSLATLLVATCVTAVALFYFK